MKRVIPFLAAALVAVAAFTAAASAATVSYSGTITSGSPAYQRPVSPGGPSTCLPPSFLAPAPFAVVNYSAQSFTVSTSGTYDLLNVSNTFPGGDSFFALYQGSFDPANPLTNLVYANDDIGGADPRAEINCPLVAGTVYILVTSPLVAGFTGAFTNSITGPGNITLGTTAVSFRSVAAARTAIGVSVRWQTASEVDMLGFNVYREVNRKRARVNTKLIQSNGRGLYSFVDRKAPKVTSVRYWIQAVNMDGSRSWYGPAPSQRARIDTPDKRARGGE